ncbi:protein ref(2)P [Anopheles aquasalis]|uniref:protein ref(2)P n=1 Tax=Anopheles aquasalis TaxID=42839 RepID=UPI00215B535E|nr:protein ref(2)P [Anopheles aquasalis]
MKITVVHKTYREHHYVLFEGNILNSFGLLAVTRKSMVRSVSPILDHFDESYTALGWIGRISWIDKDGDEILLVDDDDYHCFESVKQQEANIIIRVASTKPELDEKMKLQPINYLFDSSGYYPNASTVAPGNGGPQSPQVTDQKELPLHKNVVCDVCDGEIRGHRYKCMTCQNYDLCMSCESKFRHKEHMMLRLPTPDIRCHGAYSVFDKLRQFVTKMTPLVTGEEVNTSGTTAASEGRATKADQSSLNNNHPGNGTMPAKRNGKKSFCTPKNNACRKQHRRTEGSTNEAENYVTPKHFVDIIEALTSVAKQELKSKLDATNGNGSANETQKKDSDERKKEDSVEEDDSTDELWTVLDGLGSTIPDEVLVTLDSPGPSFAATSPVKNTEPTTSPKETDGETATPPNPTQPDVKSKMHSLTELVAAAVLEGTRLMSVPSPERPVPPPTIQDDHDEKADRVDDAAATAEKASGDSSATAATTAPSGPSQADPNKIYSELPHVNHAIHTLITMGFSNDNGWLTRLLESLDGDIPKALDLLLLQPSTTNNHSPRS